MISLVKNTMMRNHAQFKIKDNVKVYGFDAKKIKTYKDYLKLKNKEKYLVVEGKNLIVNVGLNFIKDLLTATVTGSITHCGVGSNSTAAAATDTDLNTAIGSRLAITNRYSGGTGIAKFDTFYASGDNNGTWLETIIATASAGANAFARKIIGSFVKSSSNTAVVGWTITITAI